MEEVQWRKYNGGGIEAGAVEDVRYDIREKGLSSGEVHARAI